MKNKLLHIVLGLILHVPLLQAQNLFLIEGNGRFQGTASTNLDILASDPGVNSLMRFGDSNTGKVSIGFNGNQGYFNFSTAGTLGSDDLTISETGHIGINTAPGEHRFQINHNSTSGTDGSAHLILQENNTGDAARLRFQNLGEDGYWSIRSTSVASAYQMDFYYTDGLSDAVFLSINGDDERVGIHQTAPEAYLHIKQQFAGVDAMAFENDNNANKWSFRIGDEDILIYFNNDIRGGFDVSTGNYNNFPPAPALAGSTKMKDVVLNRMMQLKVLKTPAERSGQPLVGLDPQQVAKIDPDWVTPSEDRRHAGLDYLQLSILAIKTIQEQQELISQQQEKLKALNARRSLLDHRLRSIEEKLNP